MRLTFRMGSRMSTGSCRSSAGAHSGSSVVMSSERSRPWSCSTTFRTATSGPTGGRYRIAEKSRPRAFQWSTAGATSMPVHPADHLVHGAEAEPRHVLAHLLRDVAEEVLDELGPARELGPQARVLGRDADRAGVEVADPHHDAAHDHEGAGGEPELLGAHQRADHHVAAGLHLAVHLDDDPVPQLVHDQHLLRLREPQLPRGAAVLDRGERGRAGAAVVARRSAPRRSGPWPPRPPPCPRRPRRRA